MFTGIIEEIGKIKEIKKSAKSAMLVVEAKHILEDVCVGDSISTNGVCLTVTKLESDHFYLDVMHETFIRTNLSQLNKGHEVNLERAMTPKMRMGGHMVSGHIDGIGIITSILKDDIAYRIKIKTQADLTKYMIDKGSVAIDGISLTIVWVDDDMFEVSVIPHTKKQTTLLEKRVGDSVNLECDMIGKYVYKFVNQKGKTQLTMDMLKAYGYE